MNSTRSMAADRGAESRGTRPQRTILTGNPLTLRPSRITDRLLARLLGASLDRQLAEGCAPESSALLAARAQHVASIRYRRQLARAWENLLHRAYGTQPVSGFRPAFSAYRPTIPVCGHGIAAAEPTVRELVRCLVTPLPVPARGVAMASGLLTDALGPVYNSHSEVSLPAALDAAITHLDPALPLMSEVSL
jgi:hypothetical protein